MLEVLWEPFLTKRCESSVTALTLKIRSQDEGYVVGLAGEEPMATNDPWNVLLRARVRMATAAIDGAKGLQGLHGAFLAHDGGALILAGASGAGKSTLAAHLMMNGEFAFGGDDVYCIDLGSGMGVPLPLPLAFKDLRRWPDMSQVWKKPLWLDEPTNAFVIPATRMGPVTTVPLAVSTVAILARAPHAAPLIETVGIAEATIAVAGEGNHVGPGPLKRIIAILGESDRIRLHYTEPGEAARLLQGTA